MSSNTNTCYVFSQSTLDLAVKEWLKQNTSSDESNSESYSIVAAAIPWFLQHLNKSDAIFMFTQIDLNEGLDTWKSRQINEYPHQQDRIEQTCDGILSFFGSEIVNNYKMIIQA